MDPLKERDRLVKKINAAGGVLYRVASGETELLLIFRRGVWDLPKGKKEVHETFEECAVREVSEEVGARKPILEDHLADTFHEYTENGVNYGKTTKWFAMKLQYGSDSLVPQKEEGIEDLQWISVREAMEKVEFRNLVKVIEAFSDRQL